MQSNSSALTKFCAAIGMVVMSATMAPALTAGSMALPGMVCPSVIADTQRQASVRTDTAAIGECSYRGASGFKAEIQVYLPGRAAAVIASIDDTYATAGVKHIGPAAKIVKTVWGGAISRGHRYALSNNIAFGRHEEVWRIELADRDLFIWMQYIAPAGFEEASRFLDEAAKAATTSSGTIGRVGG